ncbi:unnamed protein product [Closterium sp. NIES-65]|nr:unnamed protein product [Closterium sp. NIES-65]
MSTISPSLPFNRAPLPLMFPPPSLPTCLPSYMLVPRSRFTSQPSSRRSGACSPRYCKFHISPSALFYFWQRWQPEACLRYLTLAYSQSALLDRPGHGSRNRLSDLLSHRRCLAALDFDLPLVYARLPYPLVRSCPLPIRHRPYPFPYAGLLPQLWLTVAVSPPTFPAPPRPYTAPPSPWIILPPSCFSGFTLGPQVALISRCSTFRPF